MSKFFILAGFIWLSAAYYVENGGDPVYLWMALIPLIYVLCIQLLKDL